ncbi:MAG: ribonuclease HI family protein [bacterium]|nr:ribonuclease HI family protein [bacterium]
MELHAHIDGGARGNPGPAAIGVVIHDGQGHLLFEEGTYIGHGTNNEAEYRALIRLLEVCASDPVITGRGASILRVACDSLLIVNQVLGEWKIKEPRLQELNSEVQRKKAQLNGLTPRIRHVRRAENKYADKLVNQALDEAERKAHTCSNS